MPKGGASIVSSGFAMCRFRACQAWLALRYRLSKTAADSATAHRKRAEESVANPPLKAILRDGQDVRRFGPASPKLHGSADPSAACGHAAKPCGSLGGASPLGGAVRDKTQGEDLGWRCEANIIGANIITRIVPPDGCAPVTTMP